MRELWLKRVSNLLCVKSIVTLILPLSFAYLAITGQVSSQDFLTIFSVVVAFYFGTQSQRLNDRLDQTADKGTQSAESKNPHNLSGFGKGYGQLIRGKGPFQSVPRIQTEEVT